MTIANTYLARLVGLLGKGPSWSNRRCGLLIIPSRGVHTFGMRFPIDAIFLDRSRMVIHLCHDLQPWRLSVVIAKARSVLELPSGAITKSQTQIGDQLALLTARM